MENKDLEYLTDDEKELITLFRSISDKDKEYILFQLKVASKNK